MKFNFPLFVAVFLTISTSAFAQHELFGDEYNQADPSTIAPENKISPEFSKAVEVVQDANFYFKLKEITLNNYPVSEPKFRFMFIVCANDECSERGDLLNDFWSRFYLDVKKLPKNSGKFIYSSTDLDVKNCEAFPLKIEDMLAPLINLNANQIYSFGLRAYEHHSVGPDTLLGEHRLELNLKKNPIIMNQIILENASESFRAVFDVIAN